MSSEVDIIKKARAIIEHGWHQGDYCNENATAHCIVGALERVDPLSVCAQSAAEKAIAETIRKAHPEKSALATADNRRLASWFNDEIARCQQDVLDLFDKTLADLGGLA